ncbi:protein of unknown function [uncultured Sphingopyxis sp.]|uniref:Uncharacterized protein n=1 Tax=uncultured Sphingopyxis sp. TaxID=310581 RepID=A0A1Y5PXQ0_9SPHN|nr:protein of unknown function [uncultured Sphingopyxis sp.]
MSMHFSGPWACITGSAPSPPSWISNPPPRHWNHRCRVCCMPASKSDTVESKRRGQALIPRRFEDALT